MFYLRSTLFVFFLLSANSLFAEKQQDSLPVSVHFFEGKQKPSNVPVIPYLSRSMPYFDGGLSGKAADSTDYQPFDEGSFIKKNGHSEQKYVVTTGVWRMLAGDRPIVGLALRDTGGRYVKPGILPDIGVTGKIRLEVNNGKSKKFLEDFNTITAILSAGQPEWICEDSGLNLKIILTAHAFLDNYGCALTADIESVENQKVILSWHYENATPFRDSTIYNELSSGRYTQIFAGSTNRETTYHNGIAHSSFIVDRDKRVADTLICIWGYKDYDKEAVEKAYRRLQFRPFPSEEWAVQMEKKWFDHWIGRGLDPEKKFLSVLRNPGPSIIQSTAYWQSMRNRVRVKTGDTRFDNIVQSLGARLISNYEYPGYAHGTTHLKYGKINCGLYGHEAAGFHDEVASTLKFISGTADVKGRLRYIEPDFMISEWAEEMNPYFIDQVWYHYRWTGDTSFLRQMWPSVRRSLEHFISTSNPTHDGFFTGYYENWNGDGKNRGGSGALWTAMAIKALRAGYEMATLLHDVDWEKDVYQVTDNSADNDFRLRYKRLLEKTEIAYETRYNKKVGAYSSGDWNAQLRNMPGNEESDYAIWREIGDPLRNYTSLSFIRNNYQQRSPNGTIEFCNRDWPVCWSNHYDSYAEAMSSIASAAMSNDMDRFWPLLKTASERIYITPECTAVAGGESELSLESDQMFMMAVLDNVFGIKPYFGENLLVIRPSFPKSWKNPEIEIPDVSYRYHSNDSEISMVVTTLVDRILQFEIPVRQEVKEVWVDNKKVDYTIKKEVNECRIVVRSGSASMHEIKLELIPNHFSLEGKPDCILNSPVSFTCKDAEITKVEHPQNDFSSIHVTNNTIQIIPEKAGRFTLFAEIKKGNISWYEPIELNIREPWSIHEEYKAWDDTDPVKPARLLSPGIDPEKHQLKFQILNNMSVNQTGVMTITMSGHPIKRSVDLQPGQNNMILPLDDIWKERSPGSLSFIIKFSNEIKSSHAVDWQIPINNAITKNITAIDLRKYYNISLTNLYGNNFFKWRTDYTGAAVGVDWRDDLQTDSLGYRLFVVPTSLLSYGILPEQKNPAWWEISSIPDTIKSPVPFSFLVHAKNKNNLIALVNAENNRNIPSEAVIELKNPVAVRKIYMLTANLTKTSKSYYPAAEIEIVYETGKNATIQLIPPYNMPSLAQTFCPDAFQIPLGEIKNKQTMDYESPGLSVSDLVTDPTRKIKKIIFKCVSSETVLGLVGMSMLEVK